MTLLCVHSRLNSLMNDWLRELIKLHEFKYFLYKNCYIVNECRIMHKYVCWKHLSDFMNDYDFFFQFLEWYFSDNVHCNAQLKI